MKRGAVHTKEAIEKITLNNKASSLKVREKMRIAKLGKKRPPEVCEKIRISLVGNKRALGVKQSPEWCKNQSIRQRGEKSHFWKGGLTKLNHLIRGIFEYYLWRSNVFKRDDYTCQKCKVKGGILEAHHKYKSFISIIKLYNIKTVEEARGCAELWDINNGETLCTKCHSSVDPHRKRLLNKLNN